jgi:hypothetical protein
VRTEFDPLLIVQSLTHHPVQVHRQSSRHRDFGGFPSADAESRDKQSLGRTGT